MIIATSYPDALIVFFVLCAATSIPGIVGLLIYLRSRKPSMLALVSGVLSLVLGALLIWIVRRGGGEFVTICVSAFPLAVGALATWLSRSAR